MKFGKIILISLAACSVASARITQITSGYSNSEYNNMVPYDPTGGMATWDWTIDGNYSDRDGVGYAYITPWTNAATAGVIPVGDRCSKTSGWELYDRRLFVGDNGLYRNNNPNEVGTRYFVLYNKFTGILRYFIYSKVSIAAATAYFATLSIVDRNHAGSESIQGGLFDLGADNGAVWTDRSSRALKSQTSLLTGNGQWQVFDFEIAYSPNLTGNRYLKFRLYSRDITSITLDGSIKGALTSTSSRSDWSSLSGMIMNGMDMALTQAPIPGIAKITGKGVTSITNWLKGNNDTWLAKQLEDNQGSIDAYIRNTAAPKALGWATHSLLKVNGPTTQVTQTLATLDAAINLNGHAETDKEIQNAITVGVAEPANAIDDVPNGWTSSVFAFKQFKANGIGAIGFRRAPKVWVYSPYTQEEIESRMHLLWFIRYEGRTGEVWAPKIPSLNKHEFIVEDILCAGAVKINPWSMAKVDDYGYAIQEQAWNQVSQYRATYRAGDRIWNTLNNLSIRTTPTNNTEWIINWENALPPLHRAFENRRSTTPPSGSKYAALSTVLNRNDVIDAEKKWDISTFSFITPSITLKLSDNKGNTRSISGSFRSPEIVYIHDYNQFLAQKASRRACVDGPSARNFEFDPDFYWQVYPDIANAFGRDPQLNLEHWINHGINEGRSASIGFDPEHYLATNSDLANYYGRYNYKAALEHFQYWGIDEGREASPMYVGWYYFNRYYTKLQSHGISTYREAFKYFLKRGIYEGDQASPNFSIDSYLNRYTDLQNAYGRQNYQAGAIHWYLAGRYEGRNTSP